MNTLSDRKFNPQLEKEINTRKEGLPISPSHDQTHIDLVKHFALQLHKLYGGDGDVILASVLMHDIGRGFSESRHGEKSREKSVAKARDIMTTINLISDKQKREIEQVILEHDQPQNLSSSLESQILKDADFLSGFGAWGILRIPMWAAESEEDKKIVMARTLNRLDVSQPQRVQGLYFMESKRLALNQLAITRWYRQCLDSLEDLNNYGATGKYIVLEGISGSGKDTQAEKLKQKLNQCGIEAIIVYEPTVLYKMYRDAWEGTHGKKLMDGDIMSNFLIADRKELVKKISRNLAAGKVVISVRSYISTLVYQCETLEQESFMALQHNFVPSIDLLIVYDIDENIAVSRTKNREKKGNYEKPNYFKIHRAKYQRLCKNSEYAIRSNLVDASQDIETVFDHTWKIVNSIV